MSKKIIGVTVGTTVNPKKIGGATSYETLETENKTIVGAINELNNNIDNIAVPEALSELTDDATHRVVTDAEKSAWNAKADVSDIPTKISAFENDKEYATHSYVGQKILEASLNDKEVDLSSYYTREEVDDLIPTVPEWAQSETKPTYTADEVGALPNTTTIPTVPTKISAFENDAKYLTSYTEADPTVPSWAKQSTKPTYTAQEVGALPADTVIPEVPTKISAFENDKKYLTSYTETDPTVPAWAKADTKPTYTASEVGALPDTTVIPTVPTKISAFENDAKYLNSYTETDPTVPAWAKEPTKPTYTANEVGADPSGTANLAIGTHNTSASAHNDIRVLVDNLTTRFNALADSDDTTLDQLSEIVEYIKANKTLIEQVTTNKVNVSDIINNLTTNVNNKPLSAAQGVLLKGLIDAIKVPTKVSELTNDSGFLTTIPSEYVTETELNAKKYLTSYTETDPTVPDWAKASTKPSYTKSEVGLGNVDNVKQYSANNPPPYPVTKVNNKTGAITLTASDVGAIDQSDLNSAVNTALTQAKASGEFDGTDGTSVTVKSVSESTADGGSNIVIFSDGKTLTVKNGSKGSKGDKGDKGDTGATGENGKDGATGEKGADGVSVSSVKQTTTSSSDGGSNVITVTLSNGTTSTFTVKNGSKGSAGTNGTNGTNGTDGKTAYEYAKDGGYAGTEQEFAENLANIDAKADLSEGSIFIEGSGTTDSSAKTSTWVGSSDKITQYYDGLTIRYKIGVAGQSTTTLNINNLGAKTVYLFNTTKLTTQFPVKSIIHLIYHADLNSGCWICSDYDSNTNTYQRVYPSTDNVEYPITSRYNTTTGSSYYAEYGRYSTGVTLNPSTNTITATKFKGALTGNADTATKATQDGSGNVITSTYETKADATTKLNNINSQISQLSSEKVDIPPVATVGQVIAVKAVDNNGKPTEWEAVDMVKGGQEGIEFNPLYGKKVSFLGDSICAGADTPESYLGGYGRIIAERNNMTYQNLGQGGATVTAETYSSSTGVAKGWLCRKVAEMDADADYAIIEGGLNDAWQYYDHGTITIGAITEGFNASLDDTTYYGAFESMLKQLVTKFQGKKIGYIAIPKSGGLYDSSQNAPNFYHIALECCAKWGVPVCDLNTIIPSFTYLGKLGTTYTNDGAHPNYEGYIKYYCDPIEAWMKTLTTGGNNSATVARKAVEEYTKGFNDAIKALQDGKLDNTGISFRKALLPLADGTTIEIDVLTSVNGTVIIPFTNQVPISIDTDGSGFGEDNNGDGKPDGYESNKRLSSSGVTKEYTDSYVTGYIPAVGGDVIRIYGCDFGTRKNAYNYICAYDTNFTFIGGYASAKDADFTQYSNAIGTSKPSVDDKLNATLTLANDKNIAYIRVSSLGDFGEPNYVRTYNIEDMIITVNEEIS